MSQDATVVGVRLTSPSKVLYPEQGVTKLGLARYYETIADYVLPFLVDRPLSVVRCPSGRGSKCFYQKHKTRSTPDEIDSVEIEEKEGRAPYLVIRDLPGLVALVQIGVLEIHPWNSRADDVEHPDMLVFDLDPAPGVAWSEVVRAARELRIATQKHGLRSFVRTTGGKGLHVVCPVRNRFTWDEAKSFARETAEEMAADSPDRYLTQAEKAKRKGKIYIDYLRNSRGATAVASYSTRALPGAPVATPLRWDELSGVSSGAAYNLASVPRRLRSLSVDPWEGFLRELAS